MRPSLLLIFLIRHVNTCLPGFYGPDCELCPENHKCVNDVKNECPSHLVSFAGSRDCYTIQNYSASHFTIIRVTGGSGPKNPSNASCGCFKVKNELSAIFELEEITRIFGIVVQGNELTWVKSFTLDYSDDNISWSPVGGLFLGNTDDYTPVYTFFPFEIVTKYIKFNVLEYFLWPAVKLAFLKRNITVQKCRPRVNRQIIDFQNCTYECKNGTYALDEDCIAYPKFSMERSNTTAFIARKNYNPLETRIHQFENAVYLESKNRLPDRIFAKYDKFSWEEILMEYNESLKLFSPNSIYYLLPMQKIQSGIFFRFYQNNRLESFNHGKWITHDRSILSHLERRSIIEWGFGKTDIHLGDSQNLGFIKCVSSKLNFFNISSSFLPVASDEYCTKNGASIFERGLELYGIRPKIENFLMDKCQFHNGTFFIPKSLRNQQIFIEAEAYCKA